FPAERRSSACSSRARTAAYLPGFSTLARERDWCLRASWFPGFWCAMDGGTLSWSWDSRRLRGWRPGCGFFRGGCGRGTGTSLPRSPGGVLAIVGAYWWTAICWEFAWAFFALTTIGMYW